VATTKTTKPKRLTKRTPKRSTTNRSAKTNTAAKNDSVEKTTAKRSKAKKNNATMTSEAVTIDRRRDNRRKENKPVSVERRTIQRREKVARRRQIDPTTCERDYSENELEFMNALDEYKRTSGRMFPTCSEVLEVLVKLGYEKRPKQPEVTDEQASNKLTPEIPTSPTISEIGVEMTLSSV